MRKLQLFLLLILTPFWLLAQFNQHDSRGRKTGEWRKHFPNSKQLRYQGQFENGIEVGTFIYYHENGKIRTENVYRGKTGICYSKHYSSKGILIAEGLYVKNERDSTWRFYSDALGILISEETFKLGQRHGNVVTFFKDGKVAELVHYQDGIKHGPWEQNYEDGKPKVRGTYVNGNLQGEVVFYSDISGKQQAKGIYVNGLRDGVWIFWDEDGRPERREVYERGILKKATKY
jgi:antitoxin component YwqK of YwqJK toxin-antitoxin module